MPLVLAATPIGRVRTHRRGWPASSAAADVVAAEDTRRLRRLATDLGISCPGGCVVLRGQRSNCACRRCSTRCAPGAGRARNGRRHAERVRPGLSAGGGSGRGGRRGHRRTGPVCGADRTGRLRLYPSIGSASRDSFRAGRGASAPTRRAGGRASARWCSSRRRIGPPQRWRPWWRPSASTDGPRCAVSSPRRTRRCDGTPLDDLAAWAAEGVRGEVTLVIEAATA